MYLQHGAAWYRYMDVMRLNASFVFDGHGQRCEPAKHSLAFNFHELGWLVSEL